MCHLGTLRKIKHIDHMVNLMAKHFPKVSQKYLMKVLLPEALTTLCCQQLQITYNQADDLLAKGGKHDASPFMQKIQQRRKGKFLKKIKVLKRKMQAAEEAEDEVKFLKQARMDQTSIAKMQCPTFILNQEDTEIIRKMQCLHTIKYKWPRNCCIANFLISRGCCLQQLGRQNSFQ